MKTPRSARAIVVQAAITGMVTMALGCSADYGEAQQGQCTYPSAADYGYVPGNAPPPTLSWQGRGENGQLTSVSIADYYDCDGSRGINALLIDQSTAWCSVCQHMATKIGENLRNGWRERGIRVLTLITQNADTTPANAETARAWQRRFHLEGSAVVADPARSFRGTVGEDLAPYPYHLIVDPRTMNIVSVDAGYDGRGEFPALVELARENAARR